MRKCYSVGKICMEVWCILAIGLAIRLGAAETPITPALVQLAIPSVLPSQIAQEICFASAQASVLATQTPKCLSWMCSFDVLWEFQLCTHTHTHQTDCLVTVCCEDSWPLLMGLIANQFLFSQWPSLVNSGTLLRKMPSELLCNDPCHFN